MITHQLSRYERFVHVESGKEVVIRNAELQVKTDRNWQTCVEYSLLDDSKGASFAVPVDDFRKRFAEIGEV